MVRKCSRRDSLTLLSQVHCWGAENDLHLPLSWNHSPSLLVLAIPCLLLTKAIMTGSHLKKQIQLSKHKYQEKWSKKKGEGCKCRCFLHQFFWKDHRVCRHSSLWPWWGSSAVLLLVEVQLLNIFKSALLRSGLHIVMRVCCEIALPQTPHLDRFSHIHLGTNGNISSQN